MTQLSHLEARRLLLAAADQLLGPAEQAALEEHLHSCAECRAEAESLAALQSDLRQALHRRLDAAPPLPARQVVARLRQAREQYETLPPRLARTVFNLLIFLAWLWLYRAVFSYLQIIFSHEEFRTNQILLAGVLFLILNQARGAARRDGWRLRLDVLPQISPAALALALGGSALYLLVERYLDINTLSASLFGLASYGLLGLWLSPRRWRDGLPAALLLIGTLPFGDHLQTFVGYPMRLATAALVRDGLQGMGIHSIGVDTILVLESGLAQVDLPCSGVKSLWTGMLFLTAATWIERKPINLRWLLLAALAAALLFIANLARVGVLVLVGQVANWTLAAEMIHTPLGVLGFAGVCGVIVLLLRWMPGGALPKPDEAVVKVAPLATDSPAWFGRPHSAAKETSNAAARPLWLAPGLALLIAAMALLYTPRPQVAAAHQSVQWSFPPSMQVEARPLSPALFDWVTEGGAETADRWAFSWPGSRSEALRGSLIFLTSHTWRGQHRPERCFEVQGLTVDAAQTLVIGGDFPVRLLTLSGGAVNVSAVYWLQTDNTVTDDFARRIWADLSPQRQRWVLATLLFDRQVQPDDPDLALLLSALRESARRGLEQAAEK